jgi:hypothetical protein
MRVKMRARVQIGVRVRVRVGVRVRALRLDRGVRHRRGLRPARLEQDGHGEARDARLVLQVLGGVEGEVERVLGPGCAADGKGGLGSA